LGELNSGRSALIRRIVRNNFEQGQEYEYDPIYEPVTTRIKLPQFSHEIELYREKDIKYSDGVLIVSSVTDPGSHQLVILQIGIMELQELCRKTQSDPVIIVVGSKIDLRSTISEHIDLYDIEYMEVSSKTGENVTNVFVALVMQIRERLYKKLWDKLIKREPINNPYVPHDEKKKCILM
jgi:GTPase SAR1 family protein